MEEQYKDPLERLIKEHIKVSEYMENLEKLFALLLEEKGWSDIQKAEKFFEENVVRHFDYEEKLFPILIIEDPSPETVKLCLDIVKDHGSILKELEDYRRLIQESNPPFDEKTNKQLNALGRTVRDHLLNHARNEDENLLPILEKNRQIFDKI